MADIHILAPMAGSVSEILVAVGDVVTEGQELVIIESMKMEIPVESTSGGTIVRIAVEAPAVVEEGQLLLLIEG